MRSIRLFLLAVVFTMAVFSQSEEEYTNTLEFISKAYNEKDAKSIHSKFSSSLKGEITEEAFKSMIDSLYAEKHLLQSFDLLMEEGGEKSYLTSFEGGDLLLLFKLDTDSNISTFKITEY